eukprot:SAG22_NODE_2431_length_2580_cov_1.862555_2_plen_281_part_00
MPAALAWAGAKADATARVVNVALAGSRPAAVRPAVLPGSSQRSSPQPADVARSTPARLVVSGGAAAAEEAAAASAAQRADAGRASVLLRACNAAESLGLLGRALAGSRVAFLTTVGAGQPAAPATVPVCRSLATPATPTGSRQLDLPADAGSTSPPDGGPATAGAGVLRVPLPQRRGPVRGRATAVATPVGSHLAAAAVVRRNLPAGCFPGHPHDDDQLLARRDRHRSGREAAAAARRARVPPVGDAAAAPRAPELDVDLRHAVRDLRCPPGGTHIIAGP